MKNARKLPKWWKSTTADLGELIGKIKKGEVTKLHSSAGGRDITLISYGANKITERSANLSSAMGANDKTCYANKTSDKYKPCIFLAGTIHGGEFEGQVALMNLISIFETGKDLAGAAHPEFDGITDKAGFLILPCANPDGRDRVPYETVEGMSFEQFRYYNQGTWKDGSLCMWPECKKVHPIKDACEHLGAYFNDNGVNIMHDDFFINPSDETRNILKIADAYVPDITILLHGGTNCHCCMLKSNYATAESLEKSKEIEHLFAERAAAENLDFLETPVNNDVSAAFNLLSAIHHVCGEPVMTFESNQSLDCENKDSLEEIYKIHLLLFKSLADYFQGGKS